MADALQDAEPWAKLLTLKKTSEQNLGDIDMSGKKGGGLFDFYAFGAGT